MKSGNTFKGKIGLIQGIDEGAEKVVTWTPCFRLHGGHEQGAKSDLDFFVTLNERSTGKGKRVKQFYFRIANGVMKMLQWEHGDNILLCYDKEDQRNMMLLKHDKGYRVNQESGSEKAHVKISRIAMNAPWCLLSPFNGLKVKYTVDEQNRLLFRIEN